MRDIEAANARIIVAMLPDNVLAVIKTIPGVRSQLPIAASVAEARSSLRMAGRAARLLRLTAVPANGLR